MNKRTALSLLIAAGGCVAGAYSAYAAFSNGTSIAEGAAGTMFGLAFASVAVISWIMLPWADKRSEEGSRRDAWLWRLSWLAALGFVLANSVIYTVHYRNEMTETKGLRIEAYERAQRLEALASTELTGLRTNPRWDATSGCSDATAAKSIVYCEHVRNVQSRIKEAEGILGQGRPASKDAGAEILAWMLSVDEANIRKSLPIFWALILELIASLCMREAFGTLRTPQAEMTEREPALPNQNEKAQPPEGIRVAGVPMFGIVSPFNRTAGSFPARGAVNDNMPLAAYA